MFERNLIDEDYEDEDEDEPPRPITLCTICESPAEKNCNLCEDCLDSFDTTL